VEAGLLTELHDTDADSKAHSRGDARVDHAHMNDALAAARAALNVRNFPVGAILTVGGVHLARTSNQQQEHNDWASHAELTLLTRHSQELKRRTKRAAKRSFSTPP